MLFCAFARNFMTLGVFYFVVSAFGLWAVAQDWILIWDWDLVVALSELCSITTWYIATVQGINSWFTQQCNVASMFMQVYAVYWPRPVSSTLSFGRMCNWLANLAPRLLPSREGKSLGTRLLTGWHSGNEMRNATCADVQVSIEWPIGVALLFTPILGHSTYTWYAITINYRSWLSIVQTRKFLFFHSLSSKVYQQLNRWWKARNLWMNILALRSGETRLLCISYFVFTALNKGLRLARVYLVLMCCLCLQICCDHCHVLQLPMFSQKVFRISRVDLNMWGCKCLL